MGREEGEGGGEEKKKAQERRRRRIRKKKKKEVHVGRREKKSVLGEGSVRLGGGGKKFKSGSI